MTDVRDDLRELLQRKADRVHPHREVPRALAGRARRRIALNAMAVGLAVVVLAGGAFAGVRSFGAAPARQPADGSTTPAQPTPSAAGTAACTSGQLRANGSMDGAAGSREGGI